MSAEYLDAVVIGAGISGISAAYHLKTHCPGKSFRVFEKRDQLGGTWDLFNYPGIRSDSDMYTFGFSFRHWNDDSAIAEKHKIVQYLHETVEEFDLAQHIQYQTEIAKASWCSNSDLWTLTTKSGEQIQCRFLFMCSGYYNYDEAYKAEIPGIENFKGDVWHPQFWPEDADYKNKNVAIIGSGATAVTLVPAMAEEAKHVTMIQRSPTYLGSKPAVDPIGNFFAKWFGRWAARWWFILSTMFIFVFCKLFPNKAKQKILSEIETLLGDKFEAKHFSPSYDPWDQRVCLCPDADLFEAIKADKASIATDHIEGFEDNKVLLKSGESVDADVVVTATGLKILLFGGIEFDIDGKPFVANESYAYKGLMLSGVPNLYLAVGYTNASWTLKVDLTNRYATRMINYMDERGYTHCAPEAGDGLIDAPLLNLSSGYIQRAKSDLPKQATEKPWKLNQNYILDTLSLKYASVEDKQMRYGKVSAAVEHRKAA